LRGLCVAFPTIVATVLRRAIEVVLAIGFIVLVVVRDKIIERGAIMRSDVVDALKGTE
jgi:hypothetical protein